MDLSHLLFSCFRSNTETTFSFGLEYFKKYPSDIEFLFTDLDIKALFEQLNPHTPEVIFIIQKLAKV